MRKKKKKPKHIGVPSSSGYGFIANKGFRKPNPLRFQRKADLERARKELRALIAEARENHPP